MTGRLEGNVAIVTGATGGIGAATARRLAGEGCLLVLGGRSAERGTALAAELDAAFVQADLRVDETPERLVGAAIERFGRLDILVNNAGVSGPVDKPVWQLSEAEFDAVMDVNGNWQPYLAKAITPATCSAPGWTRSDRSLRSTSSPPSEYSRPPAEPCHGRAAARSST